MMFVAQRRIRLNALVSAAFTLQHLFHDQPRRLHGQPMLWTNLRAADVTSSRVPARRVVSSIGCFFAARQSSFNDHCEGYTLPIPWGRFTLPKQ